MFRNAAKDSYHKSRSHTNFSPTEAAMTFCSQRTARLWKLITSHLLLDTVLLFALATSLGGCKTQTDVRWINRNQSFVLDGRELAKLQDKAFTGDGKSAFEIFLHYSWGLHDKKRGEPWLRLASKLGSPDAKNYLDQFRIAQPSEYARFTRGRTLP